MDDEALIGGVIERLLAKRPDLWYAFQTDPLGALDEAHVAISAEEKAAIERAGHVAGAGHHHAPDAAEALAEGFKADLAAARAAQAIDYNPFAEAEAEPHDGGPVDESLLDEQRRLRARAEAMRAQLAEEKARLAREREAAFRKLGGAKKP